MVLGDAHVDGAVAEVGAGGDAGLGDEDAAEVGAVVGAVEAASADRGELAEERGVAVLFAADADDAGGDAGVVRGLGELEGGARGGVAAAEAALDLLLAVGGVREEDHVAHRRGRVAERGVGVDEGGEDEDAAAAHLDRSDALAARGEAGDEAEG